MKARTLNASHQTPRRFLSGCCCSLFELRWPVPTLRFPSVAGSGLGWTLLRAGGGILLCTCGNRKAELLGMVWALPPHG